MAGPPLGAGEALLLGGEAEGPEEEVEVMVSNVAARVPLTR